MAPKRKHQESEPSEIVHSSRQFQVYGSNPKPAKKPRRSEPFEYKKQSHVSSVNTIKKRIRDVTRNLERSENMPADVRIESERALTVYQQELVEAEAEKTRQKMIKKYHMVRFFERKKATRLLKKLRKQLLEAQSSEEVESLKKKMHIAEVDLNYTQYHPLLETYVSLYPPKTVGDEDADSGVEGVGAKPAMWAEIEKCMEEGTLQQLRNRLRIVGESVNVPRKAERRPAKKPDLTPVDTSGMNRRQRRNLLGISEKRMQSKNKSVGFEKNQAFGASRVGTDGLGKAGKAEESDEGGFFEE